ncbi:MAG: hypothetical protein ACOX9C_11300 [Kiritimatiellia bacterium]|jgi:hypothetical protein
MKERIRRWFESHREARMAYAALPPDIERKLRQAVRRIRSIVWLRGLLAVVAAAAIAILAIMAVDAMVMIYTSSIRWAMWGCGVAAVCATAIHMLARPLSKPFTPVRIAAMIERNRPEIEERLSTVVALLSNPETMAEGSSQLLEVLTDDAVRDVKDVSPRREFTMRTVKPKFIAAAAALGVIALLFAIWPKSMSRLVLRAVLPSAQVDNLYADNLSVSPGDAYVLEGAPLPFELAIKGGYPQQAYLRMLPAGADSETVERMRQTSSEKGEGEEIRYYRHFIAEVPGSFRYRVACGSALTRFYSITAVPVPAYTNLVVTCEPPAYTGQGAQTNPEGVMAVEAVAGSRIGIGIKTKRPLSSALILSDGEREGVPAADGTVEWSFELSEETAGMWSIRLHDAHGFTNTPVFNPVRIVKDLAPTIELVEPERLSFTLPPYGELPIRAIMRDDFGLAGAELRVGVGYAALERVRDVALAMVEPGVWKADVDVALANLIAGGVGKARVQLAARDNLPETLGGPQEAFSAVIEITLDRAAPSLAAQMLEEQADKLAKAADATVAALDEALREAKAALAEIDRQADEAAMRRLGASLAAINKAEMQVLEMIETAGEGMFESLVPEMRRLLQHTIQPARAQADVAMLSNPEARRPQVVKLIEILEDAIEAAAMLEDAVDERREAAEEAMEMADLADRQEALAEQAEQKEMTPEEMEAWRKAQEALKEEFGKRAEEPAPAPLEAAKKQAEALAEEIDKLKQEQEDLRETVEKLENPATAEEAKAELEQRTPEMPEDAAPEARAEALQQDVAERAEALQEQVAEMAEPFNALDESFKELISPVSEPLDSASSRMEAARQQAEAAAEQMAPPEPQAQEGQPMPDLDAAGEKMEDAAQSMKDASEALEKAGEAMDALSEQLGRRARDAANEALEAMKAAMEAAQEAQETPSQEGAPEEGAPQDGMPQEGAPSAPPSKPMQPAAEQAGKAAEQMKSLAEQLAQQAGLPQPGQPMPGRPEPGSPQPGLPEPGKGGAMKARPSDSPQPEGEQGLRGVPGVPADWFKMRGEMSTEALSDALESVPVEYRELVKAYFNELSKEGK